MPTKYRLNKVKQLRADAVMRLTQDPSTEPAANTAKELLHELQVHQIELEMQNEHLPQAHDDLAKSRDRSIDFYEFSPIG